jgi:asparagine synthase (glutamine-hydrolysing)
MCGITGIFKFNKHVQREEISDMNQTLIHRGPDGEGIWIGGEKNEIGFGHRRLSIIDLSGKAAQPMHSASGRYVITFNGEIYNFLELKIHLPNHRLKSNSDTEILLELFESMGPKMLNLLDGMFAISIWDNVKKELFCARDRFGEKPFFFSNNSEQFAFASEMKALFAIGIKRDKNLEAYYNYLLYNSSENPNKKNQTFYKNISRLEPATYMVVNQSGIVKKEKYWEIDLNKTSDISFEDAQEKFYELLETSVKRRLRCDVPVGSSLSGGLDSSTIVYLIDQLKNEGQVQKTFSAKFPGFERDESYYMNLVNEQIKSESFDVYPTSKSTTENFETIMKHQEEPFGSLSISAQFEVMKSAKKNGVTVLLDGQGADEFLSGYGAFNKSYLHELYKSNKPEFNTELKLIETNQNRKLNLPNKKFLKQNKYPSLFDALAKLRKNYSSSTSEYFLGIHPELVSQYKRSKKTISSPTNLKEHLYFYCFERGLNELLRYSDRNSMANSVEVRLPFLFHELVEFVFSLPNDYLIRGGWNKAILRHVMNNKLPDEVIWRKDKIGYEPPQKKWESDTFYREKIANSKNILKKAGIISNPREEHHWKYLVLGEFHEKY